MSDDAGEIATQLIEVREWLEDLAEATDELGIKDSGLLASTIDQQGENCLRLAQAVEVRAESRSSSDFKIGDDQVLTDGGRCARRERPIDRTFRLRCNEADLEFFKELDGSYLEAARLDGRVEVYCGFFDREHVLEVVAP